METMRGYLNPRFKEASLNFFIKHLEEKLEPVKNKSAQKILNQLEELYKEVKMPTTLALALSLLAGNLQNKGDDFIKEFRSKQGDDALSMALKGEFCSDGFGRIDRISEEGIIFLRSTYFPGAGNDNRRREEVIASHGLKYKNGELLILEAKLASRFVEVRVDDGGDKLYIKQTTAFTNTQTGDNISLIGPLIVSRSDESALYTSEKGKDDWIKVIDIIREPGILKD